jgi:hypothetical protein
MILLQLTLTKCGHGMCSMRQIAGFNFLQYYPQQAPKIFALIKNVYVAKLPQSTEVCAHTHIILFLRNVF